ncbi:MAG: hypothetical protein NTX50_24640 [Candidatus Sumerlaeota bacterium]|nr:hypothetical protein [Candidatus Sumerlaeota bacterium]
MRRYMGLAQDCLSLTRSFAVVAVFAVLAVFPRISFAQSPQLPDRFVWVFGWNLTKDSDVADITGVIETGAKHGLNGAEVSFGLDTLCKKTPEYLRRLDAVRAACERNKVELIPAVFSVGYGSAGLAHDRNLAEGLLVEDATFAVKGETARFVPDDSVRLANGSFEEYTGNKLKGISFHDQPGEISFVDTQVKHSGKASLRLENFTANQHGHGRVSQEVRVQRRRCYRVSFWVKTEALEPASAFKGMALAGKRELAPRSFNLPSTTDWRKETMLFNSMGFESVRLYAGVWGAKSGKLWIDDWTVEEIGPINVLHRPGTPVTVRSEDGATTYTEGRDYAPLVDPNFSFGRVDRDAPALKLLSGGRIRDGQRLRVSWYHPMTIHDGQVTVCMGEPALYEIFDHEARLLAERLHPRRVQLNMDEIRMGGTCQACRGRNMGELLGECITSQVKALRRYLPEAEIYIWSDMLDPNHNAHGDYYLVEGDYTGSWEHVPKDLIIAVWGGKPGEKNMRFFADLGFRTLAACYYDADNLNDVKGWLDLARATPKARGLMYTPWRKKYELLPAFGDLLQGNAGK